MELIWLAIAFIGILVIIITLFFALPKKKLEDEMYKKTGKHPGGYYMSRWMSVGIAIGIPIGIALDLFPVGIGIGLAIGVAIGTAKEKEHKDELRPLTEEERELTRKTLYALLGLLLLGLIAGVAAFFYLSS